MFYNMWLDLDLETKREKGKKKREEKRTQLGRVFRISKRGGERG